MANSITAEQRGLTRENSWESYTSKYSPEFELKFGKGINASEVLDAIGIDQELIQTALAGLQNFTDRLGDILDILATALDVIGAVLGIAQDLFEALTRALEAVVTSIINLFTGISVIAEIIEVTIPTPAEGPSLGVAPSGTCM